MWEVERLLLECNEIGELPQILVMENVPQVHNKHNLCDFEDWIASLEYLGYKSYYQDLNSKDYGIPQSRNRCFMVSILNGERDFKFPEPFELKTVMKDFLEDKVDERYYIKSDKARELILRLIDNKTIAIKQATKNGYVECKSGGLVDLNYPSSKTRRGRVIEKGKISPTLQTGNMPNVISAEKIITTADYSLKNCGKTDIANCICARYDKGVTERAHEGSCVVEARRLGNLYGHTGGNYAGNVYDKTKLAPTLNAMQGGNRQPMIVEGKKLKEIKVDPKWIFELNGEKYYIRIRKLTCKECFRLMGFTDEEFEKAAYKKEPIDLGGMLCVAKLKGVIEKRSRIDMDFYVLNIINALKELGVTSTEWKKFPKMQENERNQNVNIVIEKLGKPAHSECAINTIKCLENTEMLYGLMKELDQHHTVIIELGRRDKRNTVKYMKITSEENLHPMRLFIILTVLELITELKIFTSTLQKVRIQGNTHICVNYEKSMVKMQFSDLKTESISINNSSTQLYKEAGNSIVVNVLEAIFAELFKEELEELWNE